VRLRACGVLCQLMALDPAEFIRRYLLHVLPKGLVRVRHYGLNGNRAKRHKFAQPAITIAFVHASRIDRVACLCHSRPHHNRSADIDPSALCVALLASPTAPTALRRASDRIQIPNTVALNPAVQSILFSYIYCSSAPSLSDARNESRSGRYRMAGIYLLGGAAAIPPALFLTVSANRTPQTDTSFRL
jgi:hypothetical protein